MYIEDRVITLNLWDTAGQEKFKSLIPSYIKDSHCVVVCYDLTSRDSFYSVEKWIADAKELRDDQALIVLAGNKADLVEDQVAAEDFTGVARRIGTDEAQEFASQRGIEFFEISALNGLGVHALFNQVAKKLTGIEVDLVRDTATGGVVPGQSVGGVDTGLGQPQQPQEEAHGGRNQEPFKLGGRAPNDGDNGGKKKKDKKKGCC